MVRSIAVHVACLVMAGTAVAQVRTEPQAAAMVDPAATSATQALFERSGIFMIAGGVMPAGHALFVREQGDQHTRIAGASVQPVITADGAVALQNAGITYRVGMPAGLACPLGEFVARDGAIAYTVPKYIDPESRRAMNEAGLAHHRIAHEFDGTSFVPLLRAADFGNTVALSPTMGDQIMAGINRANGLDGLIMNASVDVDSMVGSYINSDIQVTYHVYLMPQSRTVEIGGVPLRYYWKLDQSGAAGVFAVEMYAQDWAQGAKLTDLTAKNASPTQYDVVNFYQVAGLFRQLHETDKAGFANFVDQACNLKL